MATAAPGLSGPKHFPITRISNGPLAIGADGRNRRPKVEDKDFETKFFHNEVLDELEIGRQFNPAGQIIFDDSDSGNKYVHVNRFSQKGLSGDGISYRIPHDLLCLTLGDITHTALSERGMWLAKRTDTRSNPSVLYGLPYDLVSTTLHEEFPIVNLDKWSQQHEVGNTTVVVQDILTTLWGPAGRVVFVPQSERCGTFREFHLTVSHTERPVRGAAAADSTSRTYRMLEPAIGRLKGSVIRGSEDFDPSKWEVQKFIEVCEAGSA